MVSKSFFFLFIATTQPLTSQVFPHQLSKENAHCDITGWVQAKEQHAPCKQSVNYI